MMACLALAVLRMVALLVILVLAGMFVGLAITRPRETSWLVLMLIIVGLVQRFPGPSALALVSILLIGAARGHRN